MSYAFMIANLSVMRIDLIWAENQFPYLIFEVLRQIQKILTPKKRVKATNEDIKAIIY